MSGTLLGGEVPVRSLGLVSPPNPRPHPGLPGCGREDLRGSCPSLPQDFLPSRRDTKPHCVSFHPELTAPQHRRPRALPTPVPGPPGTMPAVTLDTPPMPPVHRPMNRCSARAAGLGRAGSGRRGLHPAGGLPTSPPPATPTARAGALTGLQSWLHRLPAVWP